LQAKGNFAQSGRELQARDSACQKNSRVIGHSTPSTPGRRRDKGRLRSVGHGPIFI
jgi:hypothetical protein